MAQAINEVFWEGFQKLNLGHIVCEISIKHPKTYGKLTVEYMSKTQDDFINNCQYFWTVLSHSCVVIFFLFSCDFQIYFQSASLVQVPGCSIYWNLGGLRILFLYMYFHTWLATWVHIYSCGIVLITFYKHRYLWLFLDCFKSSSSL